MTLIPASEAYTSGLAVPVHIDHVVSDAAAGLLDEAIPESTKRAYERHRAQWKAWCAKTGRTPMPATAETFVEYVAQMAGEGYAPSTIKQALAAIRTEHREHGVLLPDTRPTNLAVRGYRKRRAGQGLREKKAPPLTVDLLRAMLGTCDPGTRAGRRDRALILLGFTIMARRSELAALNIADILPAEPGGVIALIRVSKRDQDAIGREPVVRYGQHDETCPVRALRRWTADLETAGLVPGPLFLRIDRHDHIAGTSKYAGKPLGDNGGRMSGQAVGIILDRAARRAAAGVVGLSAHSLRSGGATEARRAGADHLAISRKGGWQDGSAVFAGYMHIVDRWESDPMAKVGL